MLQQFGAFIQAMLVLWVTITIACCCILALTSSTNWLMRKFGRLDA